MNLNKVGLNVKITQVCLLELSLTYCRSAGRSDPRVRSSLNRLHLGQYYWRYSFAKKIAKCALI